MPIVGDHTHSFDDIFAAELERIRQVRLNKRARHGLVEPPPSPLGGDPAEPGPADTGPTDIGHAETGPALTGLALSGGGIRSAAVCLGVMQAMASGDALRRCDYLSTVSGGGYIGSALTWFLSGRSGWAHPGDPREPQELRDRFGTAPDDHPLGSREAGAKTGTDNDRIDHIRGFGNYLKPIPELWMGSAVAMVLQRMTYMVMMWFFPLAFVLLALDLVGLGLAGIGLPFPVQQHHLGGHLGWLWWGVAAAILAGLLWQRWKVPARIAQQFAQAPAGSEQTKRYADRLGSQHVLGQLLATALTCAVAAALPWLAYELLPDSARAIGGMTGALGLAATLFGAVGKAGGGRSAIIRGLAVRAGVVLLAMAALLAALLVPDSLSAWLAPAAQAAPRLAMMAALCLILALASVYAAFHARLNRLSLHRFYRDRLMETFLPQKPDVDAPQEQPDPMTPPAELGGGTWQPAVRANAAALKDMCDPASLGPYHLINTNVILVGSSNSVVRNRGGESFLLSPLFVGCDRTGWKRTGQIYAGRDDLTLATAMAISGAAANPNTGVGGAGLTRSLAASRLMMLFNVRLAYWLNNPSPTSAMNAAWDWLWRRLEARDVSNDHQARCLYPGVAAVAGITHMEDSGYVELSDGGHFENLGLYELVRRRVPLIVVVDAAQDEACALGDLANAIERVRVDFGVRIEFTAPDYGLAGLYPGGGGNRLIGGARVRLSERGWAIGRIAYPAMPAPGASDAAPTDAGRLRRALVGQDGAAGTAIESGAHDGCLVFLKPTMRASLPPDVLAYRAAHPAFPHEPTADQLFDELQFEAYRQLGLATMEELLARFRAFRAAPGQAANDPFAAQMALLHALVRRSGNMDTPEQQGGGGPA